MWAAWVGLWWWLAIAFGALWVGLVLLWPDRRPRRRRGAPGGWMVERAWRHRAADTAADAEEWLRER